MVCNKDKIFLSISFIVIYATIIQLYRFRPELETYSSSPSGHFYIHYDTSGVHAPDLIDINANGIPDYIEAVGIAADSSTYVLVDYM